MGTKRILIPYNFTDLDKKALAFVSQTFSHIQEVEVTIFNVYTPIPSFERPGTPVMSVMRKPHENLSYLNKLIADQQNALEKAKQSILSNGFSEDRVRLVFKPKKMNIASHIIETAMNEKHDVIVINRKSGKVGRFFTGSVFNKVITSLKDITICIIS
jgi:hypothetical protein